MTAVELPFLASTAIARCLTVHDAVLPTLAQEVLQQNEQEMRIWSAGCASGEEAYTLNILWQLGVQPQFPNLSLKILATDINPNLLERSTIGCYDPSSLQELPATYREVAFEPIGHQYCVYPRFRTGIYFTQQDIRAEMPKQTFHLILCRNLVFTYFDDSLQQFILQRMAKQLRPGGFLVLGKHEVLPDDFPAFSPYAKNLYHLQQ